MKEQWLKQSGTLSSLSLLCSVDLYTSIEEEKIHP